MIILKIIIFYLLTLHRLVDIGIEFAKHGQEKKVKTYDGYVTLVAHIIIMGILYYTGIIQFMLNWFK